VLVTHDGRRFDELPTGARIGTGSVRRRAQLWHARPDLKMIDVRGNVDTRLRKLDERQFDALVLAEAGLRRLGLAERIVEVLPKSLILPAVGQGALGLETREDNAARRAAVAALDDPESRAAVLAERALLAALRGGCLAPVGAWGRIEGGALRLSAVVLSGDGRQRIAAQAAGRPEDAEVVGRQAAETLLAQGAAELIRAARPAG
jgi:hydroxymethylbilane synthase